MKTMVIANILIYMRYVMIKSRLAEIPFLDFKLDDFILYSNVG